MNQEKIQKYFEEVREESKEILKKMETTGNLLRDKYMNFVKNLDGFFRKNCKNEVDWLEANTTQTQQGPQLKDKSKMNEFNQTVENFRNCVSKHDIGAENVLKGFEDEMQNMNEKFERGTEGCVKKQNEGDIKNCMKGLIEENASNIEKFYNEYSKTFDDFNKKF
jgi:hypothetical protein